MIIYLPEALASMSERNWGMGRWLRACSLR